MKSLITRTLSGAAITALTIGAPFAAYAQSATASATTSVKPNDFCVAIQSADFATYAKFGGRLEAKMDQKAEQKDDKRAEKDLKIETKRLGIDLKLGERKEKQEDKRDDRMERADSRAQTDDEKRALAEVQSKIQLAVDTKNGEFAKLMEDYRSSMDKIRAEHRTEIDTAIAQSKVEIDTAITKAKTDCSAGVPSETVKANFQASIKAIHEKFKTDRSTISASTSNQLKAAIEARKENRTGISESFRLNIKSAWQSFISLFGKRGE